MIVETVIGVEITLKFVFKLKIVLEFSGGKTEHDASNRAAIGPGGVVTVCSEHTALVKAWRFPPRTHGW